MKRLSEIVLIFHIAVVTCEEFTELTKNEFVRIHNELRSQVNPQASNMEYMVWDKDLAHSARLWSEKCIWEHGQPDIEEKYTRYGQNLYIQTGASPSSLAEPSADRVTRNSWYDEVEDYSYDTNSCNPGKACGHYTQVVWAASTKIGCGYAFCSTVEGLAYKNAWLTTCNYHPPGNYRGVRPYKIGVRCSECKGNVTCYNNLCRNCSDPTAPDCVSYEKPNKGIVLRFRGDSSQWWSRLEDRVKSDLKTAVNDFCSSVNTTSCCPGDPNLKQWEPIEDLDMYTKPGFDNTGELFDVIAIPKLPTETQEQCEAVYLPNGVLPKAMKDKDLKTEWREDGLVLSSYEYGENSAPYFPSSFVLTILFPLVHVTLVILN